MDKTGSIYHPDGFHLSSIWVPFIIQMRYKSKITSQLGEKAVYRSFFFSSKVTILGNKPDKKKPFL
jgi:hypothetical protein